MSKCSICEEEKEKLYKCKSCGFKFCEECGNLDLMMCEYCFEFEQSQVHPDNKDSEE